jgi:hypothetical protein
MHRPLHVGSRFSHFDGLKKWKTLKPERPLSLEKAELFHTHMNLESASV